MSVLNEISETEITKDDLINASETIDGLSEDNRGFQARVFALIRLFPSEPNKVTAIEFRLSAMEKMVSSGKLPGWTFPTDEKGCSFVAEPVFSAAAALPLIKTLNDPRGAYHFEENSFLEFLMELTPTEGEA